MWYEKEIKCPCTDEIKFCAGLFNTKFSNCTLLWDDLFRHWSYLKSSNLLSSLTQMSETTWVYNLINTHQTILCDKTGDEALKHT